MSPPYNKAFKWDSCRVAFLVCSDFCGEIGLRKAGLGGTHPLTRRYVFWSIYDFTQLLQKLA
ncbi:DUF3265 domain-containing protein [Vibrio parahaemolyticus]|nr:DUF3265 domain-containing protein [Vibrio parahaemolyticus]HCG9704225.1 DUF3265 domain-containing protein [Vibrio parahaemolyticus]